jgi:hypothetical protein
VIDRHRADPGRTTSEEETTMKYYLTTRAHCNGSGSWISSRWTYRIVAVPDGAKTRDLRSFGVKLLWESPILATYYSHGGTTYTAETRRYLDRINFDEVAQRLGIKLEKN